MPPSLIPLRYAITDAGGATDAGLSEEAHLYRSMFEHASWGIFQTTVDGRYLTANPALARIYGYPSPAAMLSALVDIGRQLYVDLSRRDDFVRLMKENGTLSGFESEVYRRDGSVIWISESCREVHDSTGRFLYYEGTVEDITARKAAEAELRAARDRAEHASKAKSTFLANMSHELRTPLNAVLGFAEIIKGQYFGPLGDSRYGDYAADIYASGKHLLDVINDILDLAKIEAGQLKSGEEDVDVGEIMTACQRLMADAARDAGVRLEIAVPAAPITLRADGVRLKQILLNLLSNAVKFTPSGGIVSASTRRDGDGEFVFTVSDTGIGMRPEDIERAMQPFQQIDSSLARRYEGTGLGLTLTRSLTELQGGTFTLDSLPDCGTTATVRLPGWRIIGTAAEAPIHQAAGR